MKLSAGRAITAVVLLFAAAGAARGDAVLTASADLDTIRVGDPIRLTLSLDSAPGDDARFPEFPPKDGSPFALLETAPPEEKVEEGVRTRTLTLTITAWETGSLEIPALEPIGGGRKSAPIPVEVVSVGLDESGELRDVKAPLAPGRNWVATLLPWAALAAFAALIAWLAWRLRRRETPPDPVYSAVDLRPAHVIAGEAIDALEREWAERPPDARNNGGGRMYYFRISQVVREYLRNRFALPAPERTTREIMREIKRERISSESTGLLRALLTDCDMVKYRGDDEGRAPFESAIERSRRFVASTRESREVGTEEGGAP